MSSQEVHHRPEGGYRHAFSLILPLVLANSAFTIMQFTDRVLLSRHSSGDIQAAMPAGILSFTLISFFCAIAGYSGTFVAQYHGAGDSRACVRSCMAGLVLSLLSLPFFLALIPVCHWIVRLAGHAPEIQALEGDYAFWMLLGGCIESAHWVLGGFLVGRSRVVPGTVISFVCCGINIALDYALIFGRWGLPEWGIRGAAVATFVSGAISSLLHLAVVFRERPFREMSLRDILHIDWGLVWRIVRYGVPSGIQMFFDIGAFAFFVLLTGRLDALSLATSNVAFSINNLAFAPLMGFSSAAATLVGQFQGAGRSDLAHSSCWRCMHLGWAYMAAIGAVFLLLPETLLSAFRSPDAEYTVAQMLALGRKLLTLLVVWGMFDTMNIVFISALKGAGDTRFVMAALVGSSWFAWIPAEIVVLNVLHRGIVAAWVVQCLFICVLSLLFLWRWQGRRWASIRLIDGRRETAEEEA